MKSNFDEAARQMAAALICPNCGSEARASFAFWFEDSLTKKLCGLIICTGPRPKVNLANISLPRTAYYLDLIAANTGQEDPCLGFVGIWQGFTPFAEIALRRRKQIVNALYLDEAEMPPLVEQPETAPIDVETPMPGLLEN